ncbi:hypothetical protein [Hugenholtzia roseola]|nr:hypothetical protein [Hugenholtzia roseola]
MNPYALNCVAISNYIVVCEDTDNGGVVYEDNTNNGIDNCIHNDIKIK